MPRRARLLASLLVAFAPVVVAPAVAAVKDRAAPNIDLPALKGGDRVVLKALRGKVVLVDFWASWCGPCRQELPELERLKREYASKDVAIVTVNLDAERANATRMIDKLRLTLPVGLDPDKRAAGAYRLEAMPSSYVIDKEGILRFIHEGFDGPDDVDEIRKEIDRLLAK